MPADGFLLSISGLGVSLAGFSGLVAAFRRGAQWKPLDSYRLRQIPEMGLATAILALSTIPLAETTGSAATTIRLVGALAVAFTTFHIVVLVMRSRAMNVKLTRTNFWSAGFIDLAVIGVGILTIELGTTVTFEWLLILLLLRPTLAFVLVIGEIPASI